MIRSHRIWLKTHPTRSKEWLAAQVREGFDIHHANGDHSDDCPDNLVLIECDDHQKLHGMKLDRRASSTAIRKAKRERERQAKEQDFVCGGFTPKTIKGRRYWYFQTTDDESGRREQIYLGPETWFLRSMIEIFNDLKKTSPKDAWDSVRSVVPR
jgi:hypothetical protein